MVRATNVRLDGQSDPKCRNASLMMIIIILDMPITQSAYPRIIFAHNAALLTNTPHTLITTRIKQKAGLKLFLWVDGYLLLYYFLIFYNF